MSDGSGRRPNILWYCTDQQRHDTIRALGNEHINTPNLDALCESGVAFENAYCQSPICTPSRASFLTGRYPATTHVHRNGNTHFPSGETLVTRILADAGYDCGLVGKLHLSSAQGHEKRTDDGYRFFQWNHHTLPDLDPAHHAYHQWLENEKGVDHRDLYSTVTGFCTTGVPAELHQTTWVTETAIRFVEQRRDGLPIAAESFRAGAGFCRVIFRVVCLFAESQQVQHDDRGIRRVRFQGTRSLVPS